jgi:hypothetical protein
MDGWLVCHHTKDGGECVKVLGWMMSGVLLTTPRRRFKRERKKRKEKRILAPA